MSKYYLLLLLVCSYHFSYTQDYSNLPDNFDTHQFCNHGHFEQPQSNISALSKSSILQSTSCLLPQQSNLVLGERSLLIIRGVDLATHNWTNTDTELNTFMVQLDNYVQSCSFGKASVTSQMTPVYNFTVNPADNGFYAMSQTLKSLAIADGYNVDSFNVVIYIHQSTTDFGGAGALGSGNGLNGTVWSNNALSWYYKGNIHECFHAFGTGHAETIEGMNEIFPGQVTGGHDPYHFMGSEGDGGLNSDVPAYFKYFLGWIDSTEVECLTDFTGCTTKRIHEYALVSTYNDQNKYSIQLGSNLWISYEPENDNSNIVNDGVLLHHIPGPGSAVSRLLDVRPETITTLPPGLGSNWLPVIDFWDAAMIVGDTINWEGVRITITGTGGSGEERWVDIEFCDCITLSGDDDGDGICNDLDLCLNYDDSLDSDEDGVPDGCDLCPDASSDDANLDGICDNYQCLSAAEESFSYAPGTPLNAANGGTGMINSWVQTTPDNGIIEFEAGSLNYPLLSSTGEKLHISIDNDTTNTVSINKQLSDPYMLGSDFWMSILIKGNQVGVGGVWIKPGDRQDIAIGKKWGTQFSIDNNSTPINIQQDSVYWLVAYYDLKNTETESKLWVNPDPYQFDINNPDATKIVGVINDINSVSLAVERYGLGDFEFDEIRFNCDPPFPIDPCFTSQDLDSDGYCDDYDCNDNDPLVGLPRIPGTSCDDLDASTDNDIILADGCTCLGEEICPEIILYTVTVPEGDYLANDRIEIYAPFQSNSTIQFKAGNSIDLEIGTCISEDVDLEAIIEGCP